MTYQPSDIIDGKFRVVRVLGEGGMGVVYEVVHVVTKHHRALKMLHPQVMERPIVVERFLREASAAGRTGDPRIVEAYDGGHLTTGEPFVVMELLVGATMEDWIATRAPSFRELLEVVAEACEGLESAHEAGIIHRDLKPDNLFITEGGALKILDFGVSKFIGDVTREQKTATGAIIGTPHFMSPEQFDDGDIDGRSDVFALGVILYRCACGTHPFSGNTLGKLAGQILLTDPAPPSTHAPWLPDGFDALVADAMKKNRDERIASAEALAQRIRDFIERTAPEVLEHRLGDHAEGSLEALADTNLSIPPPKGESVDVMAPTMASLRPSPVPTPAPRVTGGLAAIALVALLSTAALVTFVATRGPSRAGASPGAASSPPSVSSPVTASPSPPQPAPRAPSTSMPPASASLAVSAPAPKGPIAPRSVPRPSSTGPGGELRP